jgi:glycosyltransferase involved in cell wall biosynthesis
MTEPDVTVVIPTRDRVELLLRHGLRSALSQTGVAIEIVVVDDGSADGTAERVEALADPRILVVQREHPGGASAARNAGIEVARGRWVAFLDDDDLWAPTRLARQLAASTGQPWAYSSALVVDERLSAIDLLVAPEPEALAELLRHGSAVVGGPSAVVVTRELLGLVGGFDESLPVAEDWDLWLRLARQATPARVEEALVATLDHGGRSFFRERRDQRAAIEEVMRRAGSDARDAQALDEWFANELARGGLRVDAARAYLAVAVRHRSPGSLPPALGALAGPRGLRAASALLRALGRGSHLDLVRRPPSDEPDWLRAFRESM